MRNCNWSVAPTHPEGMPDISRRLRPQADIAGSRCEKGCPTPAGVAAIWHPSRVLRRNGDANRGYRTHGLNPRLMSVTPVGVALVMIALFVACNFAEVICSSRRSTGRLSAPLLRKRLRAGRLPARDRLPRSPIRYAGLLRLLGGWRCAPSRRAARSRRRNLGLGLHRLALPTPRRPRLVPRRAISRRPGRLQNRRPAAAASLMQNRPGSWRRLPAACALRPAHRARPGRVRQVSGIRPIRYCFPAFDSLTLVHMGQFALPTRPRP